MPNPFFKLGTPVQNDEEPLGEVPIPEQYVGQNYAYRGTETHGVAPTEEPSPSPGNDQAVPVEFEEPTEPPPPVPVRIVTEESDAQQRFRVIRGITSAAVGTVTIPIQAFGPMHNRRALKIFNLGTVTLWFGHEQQAATKAGGFPILANGSEALDYSQDSAIWVSSDDGTAQPYAILVQYETET